MNTAFTFLFGGLGLLFAFAAYLLPTIVAATRTHPNAGPIFALNLLLGWTLLGWVVSLVWSLTHVEKPPPKVLHGGKGVWY